MRTASGTAETDADELPGRSAPGSHGTAVRQPGGSRLAAAAVVVAGLTIGVAAVAALPSSVPGRHGGASVVRRSAPVPPRDHHLTSPRGASAAGLVPAREVTVEVLPVSGASASARSTISRLRAYGYSLVGGAAPTGVTAAGVYFQVGYAADAALVGQRLHLPASAVQALPAAVSGSGTGGPDVVVVGQSPGTATGG